MKLLKRYTSKNGKEITYFNDKNVYGENEISTTKFGNDRTAVKFRNVGKLNEDSAIQFEVQEYKNGRTKTIYFNIPFSMVDLFIENLKNTNTATDKAAAQ